MRLHFHKYQGTGNDFILLDNREGTIRLTRAQVAALCHRRFGIGADGLMLLEEATGADFRMVYYNSDGGESTMCGNGGRCITAFARALGVIGHEASFLAVDGPHGATIGETGVVSLQMKDVSAIRREADHALLDTGSPHVVQWVDDLAGTDVFRTGRSIRNRPEFGPGGVNVNFTSRRSATELAVRTYERGVEDETLSCGTGVTAAAIAASGDGLGPFVIGIETPGGRLEVSFVKDGPDSAREVMLTGPAQFVFSGVIEIDGDARIQGFPILT